MLKLFLIQAWKHATLLKRDSNTDFFLWNIAKFLRTAFCIKQIWWLLLKRSYWTPPQGFCVLMNIYECFKFQLWEVYPSMVIHNGQCIFINNWLSCQVKNNFQQFIKINWTKFFSITSHQQLTLTNKVTQQHISTFAKSFLTTLKALNFGTIHKDPPPPLMQTSFMDGPFG